MTGFIIGLFIGAFMGIMLSAFCKVSKDADERMDDLNGKEQ